MAFFIDGIWPSNAWNDYRKITNIYHFIRIKFEFIPRKNLTELQHFFFRKSLLFGTFYSQEQKWIEINKNENQFKIGINKLFIQGDS